MNLTIPPETKVFRICLANRKSPWHILEKSLSNGYLRPRQGETHPLIEKVLNTNTHIALCDTRADERMQIPGAYLYAGTIEFSTVGEVETVCHNCFPYARIAENIKRMVES